MTTYIMRMVRRSDGALDVTVENQYGPSDGKVILEMYITDPDMSKQWLLSKLGQALGADIRYEVAQVVEVMRG